MFALHLNDTTGATNLAATRYEIGNTQIATNSALIPAIVPARLARAA